MKIHGVKLENFMLFDKLDAEFSPNVNIICGENSTGKTALIKLLYACAKHYSMGIHTVGFSGYSLPTKLAGVFALGENGDIRELVKIPLENPSKMTIDFDNMQQWSCTIGGDTAFSSWGDNAPKDESSNVVFVPPKEMISATENFASLYEEYHISFDETYYDLARLLDRPRKKTLSPEMEKVAQSMEALIGGKVRQKGKAFYLDMDGVGELRMSLVSEGYRKLATLLNLVSTGSLSDGAILFWDEPETNMNPRMVEPLVKAILALAGAGVQVFVTTHDYFVQQYFGLAAEYGERYQAGTGNLEYRFLSLNKARTADGAETVTLESASRLLELEHNAVKEEFDAVYNKEVGLIYGDNA